MIHKTKYNSNTSPKRDALIVEMSRDILEWRLAFGKAVIALPPWKIRRQMRRAEARINTAYENALMIGSMHSDRGAA